MSAAPSITDEIDRWRRESDELKVRLVARHREMLDELDDIESALLAMGVTPKPRGELKGKEPKAPMPRPPAESHAQMRIGQFLEEHRPWWPRLAPRYRQVVEARAAGKMPEAIATDLGLGRQTVNNVLFRARAVLAKAREAGGTKPSQPPAADTEDEGEPADARRGRPFTGGSVKEMPGGKFRWVFKFEGREFCGPLVDDRGLAETQRLEAAAKVQRGELPPPRHAGSVQANGNGYRWKIERNFRRYLGPTVDTEEEAEQGRVAALAALDRGEAPATAPKYRSRAQREAARADRSRESTPSVKQIGVCQPDADLSTNPGDEPATEEEKEEQPDPFADLAAVPLAEIPALVAGAPRTAPGVPTWILDRLLPEWWTAYQGVVVEGVHPDVVAYLNDTTAHEVSRKAKAAEVQIERLLSWEAGRAEDGVPLTDEDKLGAAPAAPDPLLAALGIKHEPKTQGDAKRAAMAAMSSHFHRLAPRQVQFAELYIAGKTNAEIAAEMGVRLATVDGMLAATRTRLEGCGRYTPPVAVVPPNDAQDAVIDSFKGTGVERARSKLHVINGRQRAATIAPLRLSRDERKLGELLTTPAHIERPITRGDCEADPGRPCPWVGCSHHLYLDVNPETGAIKLNFPHLEPWEMGESCSLDVADRGGVTLEETGAIVNLTRERIRQIEVRGLEKIRKHGGDMEDARERGHSPLGGVIG